MPNNIEIKARLWDPEDSLSLGVQEAEDLMCQLGVLSSDLVDCAYIDLLEQQST